MLRGTITPPGYLVHRSGLGNKSCFSTELLPKPDPTLETSNNIGQVALALVSSAIGAIAFNFNFGWSAST